MKPQAAHPRTLLARWVALIALLTLWGCAAGCGQRSTEPTVQQPPDAGDTRPVVSSPSRAGGEPSEPSVSSVSSVSPAVGSPIGQVAPPTTDALLALAREALAGAAETNRLARLKAFAATLATEADVHRALTLSPQLGSRRNRDAFLVAVVTRWAELSPVSAAEWVWGSLEAKTPREEALRNRALAAVLDKWVETAPEGAATWAVKCAEKASEVLYSLFVRWGRANPQAALRWLEVSALPGDLAPRLMQTIVNTWSYADPSAALAYLDTLPADDPLQRMRASCIGHLARTDPARAMAFAEKLSDEATRQNAIRVVLSTWARNDPVAVLAYLDRLPADDPLQTMRTMAIGALGKTDPRRALDLAAQLPEEHRANALRAVLYAWSQEDPAAALAYLDGLPAGDPLLTARGTAIVALARKDAARAFELAKAIEDKNGRITALTMLFGSVARTDVELALRQLATLPPEEQQRFGALVYVQLAAKDGSRAVALAEALSDPAVRDSTLRQVLSSWARSDPQAALRYLEQHAGETWTELTRSSVAMALAESDRDGAIRLAEGMTNRIAQAHVFGAVARQWASESPSEAAQWLFAKAKMAPECADTLRDVLRDWAWTSPEASAECANWLANQGRNHSPEVLKVMVERLARANLGVALDFARGLPGDDAGNQARATAYEMVIRVTAEKDGRKAAEMVDKADFALSPVVVNEVVYNWAAQDPEAAAAWALRLPEGSPERSMAMGDIYYQWSKKDPAAAAKWRTENTPAVTPGARTTVFTNRLPFRVRSPGVVVPMGGGTLQ